MFFSFLNSLKLHAWEQSRATPLAIVEAVRGQIQDLTIRIELIQAKALQLTLSQDALTEPYRQLVSVKGIALTSAIALLGEPLVLPDGRTARQWAAMAGLDPRQHPSGSSVNQLQRISKAGNRHLCHALYMPALSAATHDSHLRGFYEHLVQRGLKKIQAICAVMRKLLTTPHAMLATKTAFDGSRLFALPTNAVAQVQA